MPETEQSIPEDDYDERLWTEEGARMVAAEAQWVDNGCRTPSGWDWLE